MENPEGLRGFQYQFDLFIEKIRIEKVPHDPTGHI